MGLPWGGECGGKVWGVVGWGWGSQHWEQWGGGGGGGLTDLWGVWDWGMGGWGGGRGLAAAWHGQGSPPPTSDTDE